MGRRRAANSAKVRVAVFGAIAAALGVAITSQASASTAAGSATFGKATIGAALDPMAPDRKRVNRYALSVAGTVTKLTVYLSPTGIAGTQSIRALIYADSAGAPGALLATSNELTFSSSQPAGWSDLTLPVGINLQPGNYWLGVISGASTHVAAFAYDTVTGSRDYNANTYTSGPSNPFGSFATDDEQMSLYATYTPAAPPPAPTNTSLPAISGIPQVGQTLTTSNGTWSGSPTRYSYQWSRCSSTGPSCSAIAGATAQTYAAVAADSGLQLLATVTASNSTGSASAGSALTSTVQPAAPVITFGKASVGGSSDSFAADRKRVNGYTLSTAGTISKLSIYLAPASASGQQLVQGVIYGDSGGTPGSLLATTNQFTYSSTQAAGWYDLTISKPLAVQPGKYWIGVITGATSNIAGFRYDSVSGVRDVNSNTYTVAPSDPFGSFSSDSEQMSLYATVSRSADTTPPTQPSGLTARAAGSNQVNLRWTPASDNTGVTGYTVRRNGSIIVNTNSSASAFTDTLLTPSTTYSYTVDAYDAAGNHSPQSLTASATTLAVSAVQHYEYVFPSNAIDVYDMDNGLRLVKTISLPTSATDIRGAAASPSTHTLYVSYGGDGGANGSGSMLAYNLLTDTVMWTKSYSDGIDSMAITPDGKTIYMPTGEAASGDTWDILDASSGTITGSIHGGAGPHNTIISLNGGDVYLGGRNSSYLNVAGAATNTVFRHIGPLLNGGVRPFTINGRETLAFTTATGFLGFQVSDITTGKVLYTVPISGNFPYTAGQLGPSSPSHGISLSPDEKELWVMDQPNGYVHVFDVSGLPATAPKQVADIKLTRPMTGSQGGCTYDCLREGWLQHTLDGRYVWVGDSGDVISTSTRTSVANLAPLYDTRVYLEIDFSGGVPVVSSSRSGVGYVTH